ncbi:MAG: transposase, partial [Chloroflexota bacterium]
MNQPSFLAISHQKKLRCERFLDEMESIIPWDAFLARILSLYPAQATGRKRTDALLLLKIHFLQQWYNLSDPGAEEAIYDRNSFQKFLGIDLLADTVPDETT